MQVRLFYAHSRPYHTEEADGALVIELFGSVERLSQRHRSVDRCYDGIDTVFIDTFVSGAQTSAEGDCRNIVFLSPVANALHNFAEAALWKQRPQTAA